MDEGLQLHPRLSLHLDEFEKAEFPGRHHAADAQGFQKEGGSGFRHRHLRAGVQLHLRKRLTTARQYPQILDNHPIQPRLIKGRKPGNQFLQFPVFGQRVDSQIDFPSKKMGQFQGLQKFFIAEIAGKSAGAELLSAQINRICSRSHRGP